MNNFFIKLAEKNIEINAIHDYVREMCKDYIMEDFQGEPDIKVNVLQEHIEYERKTSEKTDLLEGVPIRHFSDEYLETLAIYRQIAEKLIDSDIMLFHGSALRCKGEGVIFTGLSGTGKSTHASIWRKVIDDVDMINDDKPLIAIRDGKAFVYGTPWNGKHDLGDNSFAPVKAICMLHQAPENSIREISWNEAFKSIFIQTYRPKDAMLLKKSLDILSKLYGSDIRYYDVNCNMEDEAAKVVHDKIFVSDGNICDSSICD